MVAWTQELTEVVEGARAAYCAATKGDFRASAKALESLRSSEAPVAQAWSLALNAQRWHAEPGTVDPLKPEDCAAFEGADAAARTGAALACVEGAKRVVLLNDVEDLRAWVELGSRLADGCDDSWLSSSIMLTRAWLALANGDAETAAQLAESASSESSESDIAPAQIESAVIQAYAAERAGEVDDATSFARNAVRMARTEDVPQWQYLAGIALARMRRLGGMPHLTARILRPMLQVAPRSWHGWIAWEALMAGSVALGDGIELSDEEDPHGLSRALQRMLSSASNGDTQAFGSAATILAKAHGWKSRVEDAQLVLLALDATTPVPGRESPLGAWCSWSESTPPAAIGGLCIDLHTDPGDPGPAAFVVAGPGGSRGYCTPRRIAGLAEPLLAELAKIERIKGKFERNLTTLATIALSGSVGIDRAELFLVVYGFDYQAELHRGLFNSLIHRARQVLGEHGSITTEDDVYRLELAHTLVIPDPRCGQSLQDLVLRVIARIGASGTKGTADNLNAPLRTVQTAIGHLVNDGALVAQRDGKRLLYTVEDTTFSEPTKWDIT